MRSAPVQHRGVALILVLTTIAILTAIGVDFSYSSRVSLKLAENLRDETRAYYMARSAINLSRLLLHFQKQVDQLGGQLTQGLTQMLSGGKTPSPEVLQKLQKLSKEIDQQKLQQAEQHIAAWVQKNCR